MEDENSPDPDDDPNDATAAPVLGAGAAKYLDDRAAESFKRQTDLEESIWRSLPLFTGGLLAAGAIVTRAAAALPTFAWAIYPLLAFATLALATVAFGVAFWWLWQVVKPRDFDYPANDDAIARYASEMIAYHAGQGLEKQALDDEVTRELRLYMASTFAMAAKSTFSNNQIRLSARSQVIVLLLSGFLLAFADEAIIFGHRLIHGASASGVSDHAAKASDFQHRTCRRETGAALAPPDACDPGRGLDNQVQHCAASSQQVNGGRGKTGKCDSKPAPDAGGSPRSSSDAAIDQNRTR